MKTRILCLALALATSVLPAKAAERKYPSPVGVWTTGTCDAPDSFLTYKRLRTPAGYSVGVKSIPMRKDGSYTVNLADGSYVVFTDVTARSALLITPWNGMHSYELKRC